MGANKTYQEHPAFGQNEVYDRYQKALEMLACRVLGEPYNFRQVDDLISPAMCDGGYFGDIIAEAQKQYREIARYSPQSISAALKCDKGALLKHAGRDAEIDLPTAFSMFEVAYGQYIELTVADAVRPWIAKGMSSEEIRAEADKVRKEKGLSARVAGDDGKADFERELIAAIDCKAYRYPVRPPVASLRQAMPFWEPGEYIVVAGRTGMGKSFFGLNANYQCAVDGVRSCYINLENTPKNVQKRLWQMHTGIEWQREYPGIGQAQVGKMLEGWEWVKRAPVSSYSIRRNLSTVLNTIRMDYYENGCQLAVVDYLQKIKDDRYKGSKVDELGNISAELRELAAELKIPILALAQINREAEKTAGKRPSIAELRGSGDIEQDASSIILLYRPGHYDITVDDDGLPYPEGYAEIIIGKGRDTEKARIKCRFTHVLGYHDDNLISSQFPARPASPAAPEFNPGAVPMTRVEQDVPF